MSELLNISSESTMFYKLDVSKESEWIRCVDEAVKKWGRLDIVVNNAGIAMGGPLRYLDIEIYKKQFDVNFFGLINVTKAFLDLLNISNTHPLKNKIINIGSMMSIFGSAYASAYAASKGGVVQYTKSCAIAWAKYNVQVNAILPGWIVTDMTDDFG